MRVSATTMHVAHTFKVVQQGKVAAVIRLGYAYPVRCCRVNISPNPKPWPYLHLWGGAGVVLLRLNSPPALRLKRGGGACRRLCC